jgi:hypothetical protein
VIKYVRLWNLLDWRALSSSVERLPEWKGHFHEGVVTVGLNH